MTKTLPVSFRLDSDTRKRVEEIAAKKGMSVSDLSRGALVEMLESDSELSRLRMKVTSLEDTVSDLREDLAIAVKAILVSGGSVTPDEADLWVRTNMKSAG